MAVKTIQQTLDDIWGDLRKDLGKSNYDFRMAKSLQLMRFHIQDILKEFQKDKRAGLELARKALEEK